MTNAPYMLNVDCDMFVNNPKAALHAMCLLLSPNSEKEIAYAQFPQVFYDGLKDDPYANQFVVFYEVRQIEPLSYKLRLFFLFPSINNMKFHKYVV